MAHLAEAPSRAATARGAAQVAVAAAGFCAVFVALFAPVLFDGRVLGEGDGFEVFHAVFGSERTAWTPYVYGGFPRFADPEWLSWYPPALLFRALGLGYNAFVVLGYTAAATCSFLFSRQLTGSRIAATLAGLVYGLGGFLTAHVAHATVVHAACWIPLVLLGLERQRADPGWRWLALTSVSTALCVLGGHPQIALYGLLLAASYAVAMSGRATSGRLAYLARTALACGLGVGLTAVQLAPTLHHARQSIRLSATYEYFTTLSLPPAGLLTLLGPAALGGAGGAFGDSDFCQHLSEFSAYPGLGGLALALVALGALWRRSAETPVLRFFGAVSLLAILLALGRWTPLGRLVFQIPVLNLFRVPARHLVELMLATSVLAGLGAARLERADPVARGALCRSAATWVGLLLGAGLLAALWSAEPSGLRPPQGLAKAQWLAPAALTSLAAFVGTASALLVWAARPGRATGALVVAATLADLGTFASQGLWRDLSPVLARTEPDPVVARYAARARATGTRLMLGDPLRWASSTNLPMRWQIEVADGNSSLLSRRYHRALTAYADARNVALDLLAVRYLPLDVRSLTYGSLRVDPPRPPEAAAFRVSDDDLGLGLGPACAAGKRTEAHLDFPDTWATHLGQLSFAWGAPDLADGTPLVEVVPETASGRAAPVVLRVGRDTAEWAFERSDVRPAVRHRKPLVRESSATTDDHHRSFQAHVYASVQPLAAPARVRGLHLRWIGPPTCTAGVSMKRLTLLDRVARRETPLPTFFVRDSPRWRLLEQPYGLLVYENLRARPRAWFTGAVTELDEEATARALETGQLPGGATFDPAQVALVPHAVACCARGPSDGAQVEVLDRAPGALRLRTRTPRERFLVLSEAHAPGWRAVLDGRDVEVVRTDGILMGVQIPEGEHDLTLRYELPGLRLGGAISGACALALALLLLLRWRGAPRGDPPLG